MASSSPSSSSSEKDVSTTIVSPIPTPTYGSFGSFSILTTATINVPPAMCFAVAVNTVGWKEWNRVVPGGVIKSRPEGSASGFGILLSGELAAGTVFREIYQGQYTSSDLKVTYCGPLTDGREGFRVAWIFVNESFLYRSERVQEFVETEDLETTFRDWITIGGALGWVCKVIAAARLAVCWNDYGKDLKKWLERDVSEALEALEA